MDNKYVRRVNLAIFIYIGIFAILISTSSLIFLIAEGNQIIKIIFILAMNVFSIILVLIASRFYLPKIIIDKNGFSKIYLGKLKEQLKWNEIKDVKIRRTGYYHWIIVSSILIDEERVKYTIFKKNHIVILEHEKVAQLIYEYGRDSIRRKLQFEYSNEKIMSTKKE